MQESQMMVTQLPIEIFLTFTILSLTKMGCPLKHGRGRFLMKGPMEPFGGWGLSALKKQAVKLSLMG